ncbi:hypothetical protein PENTCL1PPCAC_16117, partial [Pristionchus entomophagus]
TSWKIVADDDFDLNCSQEFSLVLSSNTRKVLKPLKLKGYSELTANVPRVFAVPQTGMWFLNKGCVGDGNVTVYTGAGKDESEKLYLFRSWSCESVPDWIFSFDSVITIVVDPSVTYKVMYSTDLSADSKVVVAWGQAITILSSGRSDDLQNLGRGSNTAY